MENLNKATLIVAVLLAAACSPPETAPPPPPAVGAEVAVTGGAIGGVVGQDGLKQYHGIPFAAAPVGDLRWAPPAPVALWDGVRDASMPGPACMQPQGQDGGFYSAGEFEMAEDCLTLNVWTRAEDVAAALPVMVWIHGGALISGGGARYPGELLTSKGVVLVTVNYRLGPFGFLAHPALSAESAEAGGPGVSGNQGLRDQIAALEWVRDNIAKFGGDAGNVTIFGESAGSLSVSLLQASPMARGLFHRVIGQSGGAFQPMTFRAEATPYTGPAEAVGEKFGAALAAAGQPNEGGEDGAAEAAEAEQGDASLAGLRTVAAEQVLATFQSDPAFSDYGSLAIVDGEVIPDEVATIFANGQQADVPVLIGSNADEGTTFLAYFEPLFGTGVEGFNAYLAATLPEAAEEAQALYPAGDDAEGTRAWVDLFGDVLFAYPMRTWARNMANVGSDAFLYWFTWAPPIEGSERYGAFHAGEIGYVFGNLDLFGATPADADREFSELMATVWTQFAKTGNPNGEGLPAWTAYTADNQAYMELGTDTGPKTGLRLEQMALIEGAWTARRGGDA